ncbi:hypothetical protein [Acanthamoeba castellanii mimivirus]|uniref:Uncharacterized protein L492 n=5 Tax=Mimivirus TaxID=315393 RepID=YL492_MIMIV|nr:hypothetical protein MIMI_gp0531 [Acanthamoeba polyphaga mimivirus]Q5UQG1.1 RecName: Full=Uncharacterized protein L492 [Acanthamoeba polyphaga mimivirus]AEQ60684.1 hypothetical protein [Acanthamoeba castellanii mamavirus]AHA45363.1 hypothetical protein HIRU_S457 [Hirudovirus strain Sangsue]AHJ40162.1 hypothetical protein [Samba virus]ALR84081.1 hypothetical protein [Niemeyer virus]AMZ02935.1 hypothetical protein [Mimivirus Bombay]EJN40926.1 hypothetical protein lvs_L422 [Acanthamoeba poly
MSKQNTYRLINPYIEGTTDTVVHSSNSFKAGKKLYGGISGYFTNHLDNFHMTIQNVQTGGLTHFRILEQRKNDGTVDYKLEKIDGEFSPDVDNKLLSSVAKLEQQKGGGSNDSSDSSDSETECFKFPLQPINRFVYFYLPYHKLNLVGLSPVDISRIFMPTFGFPFNPTIEIRFDLYKY